MLAKLRERNTNSETEREREREEREMTLKFVKFFHLYIPVIKHEVYPKRYPSYNRKHREGPRCGSSKMAFVHSGYPVGVKSAIITRDCSEICTLSLRVLQSKIIIIRISSASVGPR